MYGLRTSGQILQILAVIVAVIGILLGGVGLLSDMPSARGGGLALIGYALVAGFTGFLLGAAAQALAVIAENSDHQTRLLARLAKELPPSNRQMKQEMARTKSEPTYRKLEQRAKNL